MKLRIASLFLCIGLLACGLPSLAIQSTPTSSPLPVPAVDELTFEDPQTESNFKSLNQCITSLTNEGWKTTSYQYIGNFYESRWCTGKGANKDCQIMSALQDDRDQHVISLYTLYYPDSPTDMFGLGLQTLWVPETSGWSAGFYFSEKGKSIIGDGWSVKFDHYQNPSDQPDASIWLGFRYTYETNQTEIEVSTTLPLRDELSIYLQSPESMRDRGVEQLQSLETKVIATLDTHQITACDYAEYQGNSIPPVCTPRPMTTEEETAEITKARDYFDGQIRLLNENYQEMYTAWMNSFPMKSCWQ